ncbi:hypothetical protein F0562_007013 [Nyssa sinensis]|uniref:Uncharacterized protein n=1 Tax=Nyssa sinensis TaxID=561372 RepID=A0A5J5A2M3_9ASTE|nr:hypothetical protein F0562_007013 [Nyssa sinensis]
MRKGGKDIELPLFSFASISAATTNFSEANKLGEGGLGPVYKAWELWNADQGLDLTDPILGYPSSTSTLLRY